MIMSLLHKQRLQLVPERKCVKQKNDSVKVTQTCWESSNGNVQKNLGNTDHSVKSIGFNNQRQE